MTLETDRSPAAGSATPLAVKVPLVGVGFWVIKVLTTGMGETASDWLVHTIAPVIAVMISGTVFAVALGVQLRARTFSTARYWGAVALVSVFGTATADVVHIALGVPYWLSTGGFSLALTAVLLLWWRVEGTLSIHTVTRGRRELFYWTTVLTTFALGTAAGDWTAVSLHLGYLGSGVMFTALIAMPWLARRYAVVGPVAAFWWAYVTTRPLGASYADWIAVSHARGGLALGTGPITLLLVAAIVVAVAATSYVARRRA